jgi:hypothetical protein
LIIGLFKHALRKAPTKPRVKMGYRWGGEKEVLKVLKLDPIFIPLHFYDFKNLKLTIL